MLEHHRHRTLTVLRGYLPWLGTAPFFQGLEPPRTPGFLSGHQMARAVIRPGGFKSDAVAGGEQDVGVVEWPFDGGRTPWPRLCPLTGTLLCDNHVDHGGTTVASDDHPHG